MLHIINKSPFNSSALADCLRIASAQDAIILIEEGVYAAIKSSNLTALINTQLPVYALQVDIAARGLNDKMIDNIQITDYAGFVELTITYHPIQSWS